MTADDGIRDDSERQGPARSASEQSPPDLATAAGIARAQALYLDDPESSQAFDLLAENLRFACGARYVMVAERVDTGEGGAVLRICATTRDDKNSSPSVWEPGAASAIGCALAGEPQESDRTRAGVPPGTPDFMLAHVLPLRHEGIIESVALLADPGRVGHAADAYGSALARLIHHRRGRFAQTELLLRARRSEAHLRALLDSVFDGIVTIDESGVVESINAAATRIFGFTAREVVGHNVSMLMPQPHRAKHDEYLRRYLRTGQARLIGFGRELSGQRKDGNIFPLDLSISEIRLGDGRRFVGVMRDTSEHKRRQEAVDRMRASHQTLELLVRVDALTGIANRRHFDEALSEELRRAARYGRNLSLLMCDVDEFKRYNDTYGHLAGDECLQKIAQVLDRRFQRAGELVARFGGEEFVVILPSIEPREAAAAGAAACEEVRGLSIPHAGATGTDQVTISVGVATRRPTKNVTERQLLDAADQALYRAKANGRNRSETERPGPVPVVR